MYAELRDAHRTELRDGAFPIYRLIDLVAARDVDAETQRALRTEAAAIVDVLLFHELRVSPREVLDNAERILQHPSPLATHALAAWRESLAACTSRRGLVLIARRFGHWLTESTPAALDAVLQLLPLVAGVMDQLSEAQVVDMIRRLSGTPSEASRASVLNALTAYADTTGTIVAACSILAADAVRWNRSAELKTLIDRVPVSAMEESVDSERLLPAVADFCAECAEVDEATWTAAFDLCLQLTSHNHSSARKAVHTLRRQRDRLGADTYSSYLHNVGTLLEAAGAGTLGFSLRRLPAYYAKYGADRAALFVCTAAAIARADGRTAAQLFLKKRTRAARTALTASAPPA